MIAIRGRDDRYGKDDGIDLKRLIMLMKEAKQRIPLRVSLQIVPTLQEH